MFRGKDLTPIFSNPEREVQDTILFTFDDQRAGNETSEDPMPQPNHIHAIIEKNWKYARYFDPNGPSNVEHEMYDLVNDPKEINNLAGRTEYAEKEAELRAQLDRIIQERLAPVEVPTELEAWRRM